MMIISLVAMIGLEKCCITSACLQWLCHSGERIVARGPLVIEIPIFNANSVEPDQMPHFAACDLGLQCLPVTLLGVSRLKWVKISNMKEKKNIYSIHVPTAESFLDPHASEGIPSALSKRWCQVNIFLFMHKNICFVNSLEVPCKEASNVYSGPSCSKLTMSFVNDSLKFKSSDTQIC